MVKKRNVRQEAIKWIVRNKSIRTQKALVEELRLAGYACTQATASRDISDMGLRKLPEGVYVLAEDLHLQRMVAEFVFSVEHINNEVIIKAQSGTAPGIAAAIDAADMPEIVATIAGNDTVLGICRTEEKAITAEGMIKKLQHPDGKSRLMGDRRDASITIPESLREKGKGTAAKPAAGSDAATEAPAEAEEATDSEEPTEAEDPTEAEEPTGSEAAATEAEAPAETEASDDAGEPTDSAEPTEAENATEAEYAAVDVVESDYTELEVPESDDDPEALGETEAATKE